MGSTDGADNTAHMQHPHPDIEKTARPESDLGGDTERESKDARQPIPEDNATPADAAKVEDAGPPDGGAAAWLVVLGAWCCSFSSPGWINSTCPPLSNALLGHCNAGILFCTDATD